MIEQERAPLDEEGNIKPLPHTQVQESAEGPGRGLKNGEYVQMGDGSVLGSARVEDVHLSPDVPQFKRGLDGEEAAEDGTTYQLSGKFRADAQPITVWRRKDGRLEVITGRHRLALAKADGVQHIAVRVYDEDAAHDAKWAKLYDVEQNILDKQASAQDVAYFFRNTNMTEAEAEERGLMPKKLNGEPMATSTMGITIARRGSDEVFTRFMNGAISAEKAYFAATLGASEPGQMVALQQMEKGRTMPWVKAFVHEFEAAREASDSPQQFDLFGFDDSWAKEAEKVASYVAKARKLVGAKLDILKKAGKLKNKADIAKELGITVQTEGDVQRVRESLELLDARLEAMDSGLGIGARAAAWDGKSQVDVDELAKAGGATFSLEFVVLKAPLLNSAADAKAVLKPVQGTTFKNKSSGIEAVVTNQTLGKTHSAQMSVTNLRAMGYSDDEARRIHYSAVARIHELFEQAEHWFFEENYDTKQKAGRKGAYHFFGMVEVEGFGEFNANVSVVAPEKTSENNRVFTLELTIENPAGGAQGSLSQRGLASNPAGSSEVRVAAYRSFVEKEKAAIRKKAHLS